MSREHYFFKVELYDDSKSMYKVETTEWAHPFGLIIHCGFWFHVPVVITTEDAGPKWNCWNCLVSEHRRLKREVG